ncbi:unnamed protein product [Staurois parvus]|uniref:Immunoglobulin V-set domain-containing protein n=1 Tax=Staurois parvus TaxID=386267 RepID=A0ABN9BWP2_9NEOB|nr:unnamed protein product [Staurois parvus]
MSWSALLITSLLFCSCTNCAAQVSVTQPAAQSVSPGDTATLSCTLIGFSIGDRWVRWFQQKTGERPRYLLEYYSDTNKNQEPGSLIGSLDPKTPPRTQDI